MKIFIKTDIYHKKYKYSFSRSASQKFFVIRSTVCKHLTKIKINIIVKKQKENSNYDKEKNYKIQKCRL
jgi:hypothetical protein